MKRRKDFGEGKADPEKHFKYLSHEKMESNCTFYNGNFPYFREPMEIGAFSIDATRKFRNDRSQLKYFKPPVDFENCHFDLKKGYMDMIYKDESIKSYLNDLLKWTMLHRDTFKIVSKSRPRDHQVHPSSSSSQSETPSKANSFHSLNTDFVCWRGLLTRILCIPYENREDLRIAVIRTRGTYFMCQFDTEAKQKRENSMSERDKEMCAWGWKFEQYVTADNMHGTPDSEKPVNNNEEYGVIVRSRLGSHSLVYGAEVDCTDSPDGTSHSQSYLELKTSRIIESRRMYENFCRFKLIKFWAQSFLIGIRRIICGFRDDDGVVHHLKDFQVKDIPKLSSSVIRNGWNPSVCFNFLDSFLNFVKANIPNDDERCAYIFYWKPGSQLVLEGKGDEAFHFLPDWFLKWDQWDQPV